MPSRKQSWHRQLWILSTVAQYNPQTYDSSRGIKTAKIYSRVLLSLYEYFAKTFTSPAHRCVLISRWNGQDVWFCVHTCRGICIAEIGKAQRSQSRGHACLGSVLRTGNCFPGIVRHSYNVECLLFNLHDYGATFFGKCRSIKRYLLESSFFLWC